jgi:hypothetical protein
VMGRRTTEHRMRQRGWSPDHRVERRATGSHRQSGGLARRRGAGHRQRLRQVAERPARCTRAAASRLAVSICGVGDVRSPSGGGLVLSQAVDPVGLTSFVWRSSPIGDVRRDLMERGSAPSKPCRRTSSIRKGERTWTRPMIVLGADTHKSSHTIAAVNSATGRDARSSAGAAVGWGSSPNRGLENRVAVRSLVGSNPVASLCSWPLGSRGSSAARRSRKRLLLRKGAMATCSPKAPSYAGVRVRCGRDASSRCPHARGCGSARRTAQGGRIAPSRA